MELLDSTSSTQPIGWASSEDWTRHRTLIIRLYEEYRLKKVMKIMEDDHGFKAT